MMFSVCQALSKLDSLYYLVQSKPGKVLGSVPASLEVQALSSQSTLAMANTALSIQRTQPLMLLPLHLQAKGPPAAALSAFPVASEHNPQTRPHTGLPDP